MKIFTCVIFTLLTFNSICNAQSIICLSNDKLIIRNKKCKKSEQLGQITNLAASIKATGALAGPKGETGPQGAQGIQGPQGAQGNSGTNGTNAISGRQILTNSSSVSIAVGNTDSVFAICPTPKIALGGSCASSNSSSNIVLQSSSVADSFGSFYGCTFKNVSGSTASTTLTASVVCANAS